MTDLAHEHAYRAGMGEGAGRFANALDRLLHLRALPTVGSLRGPGMAYIAERSVERAFRAGEVIFSGDDPIDAVHFVVEGAVRIEKDGIHLLDVVAPFAFGFMPVLAAQPVSQRIVALEHTITLELAAAEFVEVFEDDFSFLENGVRQMSKQLLELQAQLESAQRLPRSEPIQVPFPEGELDLIQRIQALRFGPFQSSNLEPIVQLARRTEEIRLGTGDVLWEVGEPPLFGLNVVYGVIRCESPERTFRMGPGSSVGYLESYARLHRTYRAVAETPVVAIRAQVDDFFDILEDHSEPAVSTLRFIATRVLELQLRLAQVRAQAGEAAEGRSATLDRPSPSTPA